MRAILSCYALSMGAAAALLGACDGSQPPIGAPGPMAQRAANGNRGPSRIMSKTDGALLYVTGSLYGSGVSVYSFPRMKLVGQVYMPRKQLATGVCTDSAGDVFVAAVVFGSGTGSQSYIYEYAHGGTNPINTLSDPGGYARACSVDATTGNLAVTNHFTVGRLPGNVVIYAGARGSPKAYEGDISYYDYAAYDSSGDLFVDGFSYINGGTLYSLAELPSGGSSLTNIPLNKTIRMFSLQWIDNQLVIASDRGRKRHGPEYLYRVSISGSGGAITGETSLHSGNRDAGMGQFLVQGATAIGPAVVAGNWTLDIWRYPRGGRAKKVLENNFFASGIALSK